MAEKSPLRRKLEMASKCDEVSNKSLESTRRIKDLCDESQDAAGKVAFMLNEQGGYQFRPKFSPTQVVCGVPQSSSEGDANVKAGPSTGSEVPQMNNAHKMTYGHDNNFVRRILDDWREDEMEDNLGRAGDCIERLRNMALDIGVEIEHQNQALQRIMNEAVATSECIDSKKNCAQ